MVCHRLRGILEWRLGWGLQFSFSGESKFGFRLVWAPRSMVVSARVLVYPLNDQPLWGNSDRQCGFDLGRSPRPLYLYRLRGEESRCDCHPMERISARG